MLEFISDLKKNYPSLDWVTLDALLKKSLSFLVVKATAESSNSFSAGDKIENKLTASGLFDVLFSRAVDVDVVSTFKCLFQAGLKLGQQMQGSGTAPFKALYMSHIHFINLFRFLRCSYGAGKVWRRFVSVYYPGH